MIPQRWRSIRLRPANTSLSSQVSPALFTAFQQRHSASHASYPDSLPPSISDHPPALLTNPNCEPAAARWQALSDLINADKLVRVVPAQGRTCTGCTLTSRDQSALVLETETSRQQFSDWALPHETSGLSWSVLDAVDASRDGRWTSTLETIPSHSIADPDTQDIMGLLQEVGADTTAVPSWPSFQTEGSRDVATAVPNLTTCERLLVKTPGKIEKMEGSKSASNTLTLSPPRDGSEDEEWSEPIKRTTRAGRQPSRADNARRRISSMTSSSAERVRRLARSQATQRRKAQKDQVAEQAVLRLVELDRTYAVLQTERETLNVQRSALLGLLQHLRQRATTSPAGRS